MGLNSTQSSCLHHVRIEWHAVLFAVNIGCPLPLQIPSHYQLPLFATSLSSPMIPHVSPAISNLSGYVQQQDVFIGAVTVREALMFSADLRHLKRTGAEKRMQPLDGVPIASSLKVIKKRRKKQN